MKQVIVVIENLQMTPGKLAAQVAHASVSAVLDSYLQNRNKVFDVSAWEKEGQPKVILSVPNEDVLFQLQAKAKERDIKTYIIRDAGRTELTPGTITCMSIGPEEDSIINKLTGNLKLL